MNKIFAPQDSANDEVLTVLFAAKNLSDVKKGDLLFELEASKTVIDVRSEAEGVFHTKANIGEKVRVGSVIGIVAARMLAEADLLNLFSSSNTREVAKENPPEEPSRLILNPSGPHLVSGGFKSTGRLVVLGGGMGLSQTMEILKKSTNFEYVGVYDDILWRQGLPGKRYSAPVLGPIDKEVISQDYLNGVFDSLVISISTSIEFREKWMEIITSKGINFPNLLHPSAQIDETAVLGIGNIVLPNVHIGPHARIGSNNFISAFSNIEHHCYLGNSNTFGPGVILSGGVRVGSRCRFGTGIFIEPKLKIGDDSVIASGQSISNHIEANTTAKKVSK